MICKGACCIAIHKREHSLHTSSSIAMALFHSQAGAIDLRMATDMLCCAWYPARELPSPSQQYFRCICHRGFDLFGVMHLGMLAAMPRSCMVQVCAQIRSSTAQQSVTLTPRSSTAQEVQAGGGAQGRHGAAAARPGAAGGGAARRCCSAPLAPSAPAIWPFLPGPPPLCGFNGSDPAVPVPPGELRLLLVWLPAVYFVAYLLPLR